MDGTMGSKTATYELNNMSSMKKKNKNCTTVESQLPGYNIGSTAVYCRSWILHHCEKRKFKLTGFLYSIT